MDVFKYCFMYAVFATTRVVSVPPAACFADFRWDDCGKSPVSVMYYWKPGSRCEVGLWRGCLPNINMFRYEYECVSTCIFSVRAMPEDYHNIFEDDIAGSLPPGGVTVSTVGGNGTDPSTVSADGMTHGDGDTTTGGSDSAPGAADGTGPAGTSGDESATTAAS